MPSDQSQPGARPKPYDLRSLLRDLQAYRSLRIERVGVAVDGAFHEIVGVERFGDGSAVVVLSLDPKAVFHPIAEDEP